MKRFVLLLVLGILLSSSAVLAQDTIKIGFIYVLSGRGAVFGEVAKRGAELAIEEINSAGGISGKKLVGIFEDDQGKPEIAVELTKRFVQKDRVDAIIGVVTSGSAEAVAPLAAELKVPLIITTATTPVVTGQKCNRYTFRVTCTTDQTLKAAALVAAQAKAKTWTTIGPDYLLGYETWDYFQRYLSKIRSGVTFLPKSEVIFAPMTTTDWGPHIKKIMNSGADGIVISLWGGNAVDFLKQAAQEGLFNDQRSVIMTVAGSMDVFVALGLGLPQGIWFGNPYWFQANTGPVNEAFVHRYQERFQVEPSYSAATAYTGVIAYCEALKRSGSPSPDAVVRALEGLQFDAPLGKVTIRPEDHQALFNIVWGQTSQALRLKGGKVIRGWDPILSFGPDEVLPSPAEAGCKMR
ncbi:MAG: ABC transporter substrate-binding protein [Desulfomonile tiedjei]|uniref:ABC transporter substrate-binding protein n=1 Tax=Desulfomonile tiedjei TaxID=2358 RepID=A0A9D6Z5D9_9BACT|nr:ABC transporter substrate-binding protein [Desulfomonile tiedjei]